ncbi:cell wall-binding repeat-containing protein [Thermococcus atlanticus]
MMGRKALALAFSFLILAVPLTFRGVSAATPSVVILVSDNEADCTLAQYIANLTGVPVVTTPWGVYDPNITTKIVSYAPDEVIIIGGPAAVPDEYVEDLQNLSITVERWWGKNRYETDLAVIKNATSKFQLQFQGRIIIAAGNDTMAIEKALQVAIKERAMIVFVNRTSNISTVMMKLKVKTPRMMLIGTPFANRTIEKIRKQIKEHFGEFNCSEMRVNITAESVLKVINSTEARINTAESLLKNVTSPAAERMLELAKKQLTLAKEAYKEGKYGEAYGLAIAAGMKANFVVKFADRDFREELHLHMGLVLRRELFRLGIQIGFMKNAGIDVQDAQKLLEEIKAAIKNGDYDTAHELLAQLKELLREKYRTGRGIIKEKHHPVKKHRP